jgi:hypothetical protein
MRFTTVLVGAAVLVLATPHLMYQHNPTPPLTESEREYHTALFGPMTKQDYMDELVMHAEEERIEAVHLEAYYREAECREAFTSPQGRGLHTVPGHCLP